MPYSSLVDLVIILAVILTGVGFHHYRLYRQARADRIRKALAGER